MTNDPLAYTNLPRPQNKGRWKGWLAVGLLVAGLAAGCVCLSYENAALRQRVVRLLEQRHTLLDESLLLRSKSERLTRENLQKASSLEKTRLVMEASQRLREEEQQEYQRVREQFQKLQGRVSRIDETRHNLRERTEALAELARLGVGQLLKEEEFEVLTPQDGEVVLRLSNDALFEPGRAALLRPGQRVLVGVAELFRQEEPRATMRVEGHSDSTPIGPTLRRIYPSNWELSAARACSVVRFLAEECSLSPERMLAAGRADSLPLDPADTPEARSRNRRIEIALRLREDDGRENALNLGLERID